jgi:beta-glucanase (GH16 family)
LSVTSSSLTTNFNTYRLDWTPTSLTAYLNDAQYWVMTTNSTMPFSNHFFLIANLALGGNKGAGDIDPNFTEDSLEIDYIRVYQNYNGSLVLSDSNNYSKIDQNLKYYKLNGNWHIESSDINIEEVYIYDVNGKLIKRIYVKEKNAIVNAHNLKNGLYFFQIINKKGHKTLKIVN